MLYSLFIYITAPGLFKNFSLFAWQIWSKRTLKHFCQRKLCDQKGRHSKVFPNMLMKSHTVWQQWSNVVYEEIREGSFKSSIHLAPSTLLNPIPRLNGVYFYWCRTSAVVSIPGLLTLAFEGFRPFIEHAWACIQAASQLTVVLRKSGK